MKEKILYSIPFKNYECNGFNPFSDNGIDGANSDLKFLYSLFELFTSC